MRYLGQNWEISVPIEGELTLSEITRQFDEMHDRLYGFALDDRVHELLSVRVAAIGPTPGVEELVPGRFPVPGELGEPAGTRPVWDDGSAQFVSAPVHTRGSLPARSALDGPSVVEGTDAAVWIPPGWHATVDDAGNLVLVR